MNDVANVEDKVECKAKKFVFRDFTQKGWPFIDVETATAKRWAHKEDGTPTKIYFHALAQAQAVKRGEPKPIRARKAAPEQDYMGVKSPFDLRRRSGNKTIWQVLVENVNQFVSVDYLNFEVNDRMRNDESDKTGWYDRKFVQTGEKYDALQTAIVLSRAPYNGVNVKTGEVDPCSLEGMQQRIVVDEKLGVMLQTNVTEPRQLKKRGRKPKVAGEVVADNDDSKILEASDKVDAEVATV